MWKESFPTLFSVITEEWASSLTVEGTTALVTTAFVGLMSSHFSESIFEKTI